MTKKQPGRAPSSWRRWRKRSEKFVPDPVIPLIRTARQQLEAAPGGPLGWLLEFVRSDPTTWLPGDVDGHGHRLLALIYPPLPENVLLYGREPIPPITPADVEKIREELYEFFHRLVTVDVGVNVTVPTDGLTEVLLRASARSADTLVAANGPSAVPSIFGVSRGGPRKTLLYQEIKQLVLKSDRLMACPMCERPFLALRKKKFCDSECLRKWYDRPRPTNGSAR